MVSSLFLSLSYFTVFMLFCIVGLYTLYMNPKEKINQLFFLVCFSAAIWSFSFSVMAHTLSHDEAIYWARISYLGRCTLYVFLLHVTIHHSYFSNRIPTLYFSLVYVPPLLLVCSFLFGSDANFNPVLTSYGYVDVGVNIFNEFNILTTIFSFYYVSYMILVILLNYHSAKKSETKQLQVQSYIILSSYLIAITLGITTDILQQRFSIVLPRMSIFFTLIPMAAIFFSIRNFGFLQKNEEFYSDPERILNHKMKLRLYLNLGLCFIVVGFLNFIARFHLAHQPVLQEIYFSGLIMISGILLGVTQRLPIKEHTKDLLTTMIIGVSIPLINFRFSQFSSITVWTFPLFLLLFSTLFDKKWMIIGVGISAIFSEFLLAFTLTNIYVSVDSSDYLIRIIFFFTMMFVALYVRRSFHHRLLENKNQINFQKSIALITQEFIAEDIDNSEDQIRYLLQIIGEYCQSDRTYIFFFSADHNTMLYRYEWCQKGIAPAIDEIGNLSCSDYPWWVDKILHDPFLYIPNVSNLPSEAFREREILQMQEIHSLICVPISKESEVIGFMGLDFLQDSATWTDERQSILRILSGFLSDFFERKQVEQSLYTMAYFDPLTNLPNRLYFNETLDRFITERKHNLSLSVMGILFLDLDNFKSINETMGYSFGDLVLKQFSEILSSLLSPNDILARFSGDEFVILLPFPADRHGIEETAKKIMTTFRSPLSMHQMDLYIEFSMGIAIYPVDGTDSHTLIKNADITMYKSKHLGKNQYHFCSVLMQDQINEEIHLNNHLHHAIANDELQIYYQPQVNTETGRIVGFEALLRWFHPTLGVISPDIFIPIAEQTGLIHSIGKWVLLTACKQVRQWNDRYQFSHRIAVNLSTKQLNDPELAHVIKDALDQSGLSSTLLELEITESEDIDTENHILNILHELKDLNLNISIDDFGTKYSSLGRLKVLPLSKIKIDMEFIRGISINQKDRGITKSIIDLSKNLGLTVIAEGVEEREQLDFLTENQCDEIQGYYFYKPMSTDGIETLLREQTTDRSH